MVVEKSFKTGHVERSKASEKEVLRTKRKRNSKMNKDA
jgi:hypothetical protein